MYKILICGHFGGNENFYDGQTIKTKNIYSALLDNYSEKEINKIDTCNCKRHPIRFFKRCFIGIKKSKNIIILPAQNGVKILIPLFVLINKLYKRKLFYVVIGGWLPDMLKNKKILSSQIKKLDKVFVETKKMKEKLNNMRINNIEILINFKNLLPLKKEDLNFNYSEPYKLCTFSRVMKEKGIEDAINVIKEINKEANKEVYQLDIYGAVDTSYKEEFRKIMNEVPKYIQYKGCIDSEKSVEVLKNYYLLLFPTRFKTEGIPGTIIDALLAGIPTVAAKWDNADEILEDNKTGIIYEFENIDDFKRKLDKTRDNRYVIEMKKQCLLSSKKYQKENAIKSLVKEIENVE